jgi:hypothetical protein
MATLIQQQPHSEGATKPPEIRLHAIVFQRGEFWIATCLEHCFVTQARTEEALLADLERIIKAHILLEREHGKEPFLSVPRAPERYWEMYRQAASHPLADLQVGGAAEVRPIVELRAA